MKSHVIALFVLAPISVACVTPPSRTHFEVDLKRDIPLTAGMFAIAVLVDSDKHEWNQLSTCGRERRFPTDEERKFFHDLADDDGVCDDGEVNRIDHWVTRLSWAPARRVSDLGLLFMLGVPFGVSAVDTIVNSENGERFGVDTMVIAQTYATTFFLGALVKVAAGRPRPLTYNKAFLKGERFAGDARLSFPSGHTSMSFTAASVTSVILLERYGLSGGSALGMAGAYLSAATVGVLRMAAGKHFLTDVVFGAALGTVFGVLIPSLHLNRSPEQALADVAVSSMPPDRVYVPVVSLGGAW